VLTHLQYAIRYAMYFHLSQVVGEECVRLMAPSRILAYVDSIWMSQCNGGYPFVRDAEVYIDISTTSWICARLRTTGVLRRSTDPRWGHTQVVESSTIGYTKRFSAGVGKTFLYAINFEITAMTMMTSCQAHLSPSWRRRNGGSSDMPGSTMLEGVVHLSHPPGHVSLTCRQTTINLFDSPVMV
jgi:hypothetical protein